MGLRSRWSWGHNPSRQTDLAPWGTPSTGDTRGASRLIRHIYARVISSHAEESGREDSDVTEERWVTPEKMPCLRTKMERTSVYMTSNRASCPKPHLLAVISD